MDDAEAILAGTEEEECHCESCKKERFMNALYENSRFLEYAFKKVVPIMGWLGIAAFIFFIASYVAEGFIDTNHAFSFWRTTNSVILTLITMVISWYVCMKLWRYVKDIDPPTTGERTKLFDVGFITILFGFLNLLFIVLVIIAGVQR